MTRPDGSRRSMRRTLVFGAALCMSSAIHARTDAPVPTADPVQSLIGRDGMPKTERTAPVIIGEPIDLGALPIGNGDAPALHHFAGSSAPARPEADAGGDKAAASGPAALAATRTWAASAGGDLHKTLSEWAKQVGWSVVWNSNYDYELRARANFTGNFEQAVKALVDAITAAGARVYVRLYAGNRVVVVSDSWEE